ncbi:unnamed protein product [Hymenolepis diminuta]|uniref:PAM2 domain-containing protein n=1 Tax=Hymenolepis diminuta TaxID=6216 RepID=A0A0R3STB2_HYMDI|nr:unnamed protein product [Hymenolepis diminuta]
MKEKDNVEFVNDNSTVFDGAIENTGRVSKHSVISALQLSPFLQSSTPTAAVAIPVAGTKDILSDPDKFIDHKSPVDGPQISPGESIQQEELLEFVPNAGHASEKLSHPSSNYSGFKSNHRNSHYVRM